MAVDHVSETQELLVLMLASLVKTRPYVIPS